MRTEKEIRERFIYYMDKFNNTLDYSYLKRAILLNWVLGKNHALEESEEE